MGFMLKLMLLRAHVAMFHLQKFPNMSSFVPSAKERHVHFAVLEEWPFYFQALSQGKP